ncbi:hypothetical protein [Deinococcus soli (ex Cha et al. 2016)]|uniref:Uncharacterized protein n=2 Tax=Deinococcus soli (ex Cha et al. 2016) TaxID=1309411 RepID=A0AAE4BLU8_9DEIO|nr:hypothetical protein [Deinococcus soli (ex Cha et al. 2016)]MDR6217807.1 hypothetical protein [Deinococcus soli (ex Cha et al. 2016)]MDR6328057.1 hypothetical protein [Deinococcus soli (ex Cha et al. 2016)]MDR6750909.1 hypothetical protein [Deinococcus soli (ex Cha et al. 2016)]
MALRPRSRAGRATRLKRLAFVLVVLGSVGGTLGALLLSAQVFDRLSRASAQVDALSLARRPASSATLGWQAAPPGTRQPDGLTLEDLRQAYLLAFSELTYAHGSGDTTGLPGRFGGRALQEAVAATTPRTGALVLDWGHRATPLGLLDDRTFRLQDDLWTLRTLPGSDGWQEPVVRRETRSVTLQQSGRVWRVTHWRVTEWRAPQTRPSPPLPLKGWRAVILEDWSDWTRDEWTGTLRRVRRAGLNPVALAMPDVPTLNTGRALGLGVRLARQAGLDVLVTFGAPLTLESLPSRVTAGLQASGALALLPGPLPDSSLRTARAIQVLRAAQPLPLVTEGAPVRTEVRALIAGTVTDAPSVGTITASAAFRLPAAPRLPWKQAGFLEAASALPDRGWLSPSLDALTDTGGGLTPLGRALLRR